MKLTFIKTITFVFLLALLAQMSSPLSAFAEDEDGIVIRWDDSSGNLIEDDSLFNADNIYPGWSDSKTIYVKNESAFDTDLYFKLDVSGDEEFAKELKLYVTRLGGNKSIRIGGTNDHYNLNSADGKSLFLDKLNDGSGKQYRIKIKFNEDAGNDLQGLSTEFDAKFTIEDVAKANKTEADILTGQGRLVPTEHLTDQEAEIEVLGENTPDISDEGASSDETGFVKGASTNCKNIDKNPWLLALVALAIVLGINGWRNSKESGYGWKLDALGVGILLITWYLLESCHLLRWVPISAVVIGIAAHFLSPFVFGPKK